MTAHKTIDEATMLTNQQIRDIATKHFWGGKCTTIDDLEKAIRAALELLSASKPAEPEGWKLAMVERSYEMRVKAIIAFNTAEQSGKDRDDALDAAWQAMLAASPAADSQAAAPAADGGEQV